MLYEIQVQVLVQLYSHNGHNVHTPDVLSCSMLMFNLFIPYINSIKLYRTIILPVVLYGCETWSLTLREECRLRVFENRVLRRIFGPKRNEVTGEWKKNI
jgi:hypothetical protein